MADLKKFIQRTEFKGGQAFIDEIVETVNNYAGITSDARLTLSGRQLVAYRYRQLLIVRATAELLVQAQHALVRAGIPMEEVNKQTREIAEAAEKMVAEKAAELIERQNPKIGG